MPRRPLPIVPSGVRFAMAAPYPCVRRAHARVSPGGAAQELGEQPGAAADRLPVLDLVTVGAQRGRHSSAARAAWPLLRDWEASESEGSQTAARGASPSSWPSAVSRSDSCLSYTTASSA